MSTKVTAMVVAIPDQVSCQVADDVAILSLRDGCYYGLNPVGARIWNLIQQPIEVEEIVSTILEEYDVAPEKCQADVTRMLNELAARGLLDTL